jgi:hypothetical protein
MDTRGQTYATGLSHVGRRDGAHDEFGRFWRGTFLGIALSLALWTMLLGLGAMLR